MIGPAANGKTLWESRLLSILLWVVALPIFLLVVIAPLDGDNQLIFAVITGTILLLVNRLGGHFPTIVLSYLSICVSCRYMLWRATDTLGFTSAVETFLGYGLFLAEVHNLFTLFVGYFHMTWILDRRPVPLPADVSTWPTVDVFIPTYNESLEIVRRSVFAAMRLDYPVHKFTVNLLDDGRREEFRAFARSVGVNYIVRSDNNHAKAGNLNNALKQTHGDLVAVFDCDHVPTRAFLQMTVGWFLRDRNLALLQTPHHFYSPDPFQRNLKGAEEVPDEGKLFYGVIQAGKDLWNAVLFCGSCALLSRKALDKIGGFAVETVVEDAHTSLRLAAAGYSSAYLRFPLAAGLATERMRLHIGQRVRWGRGMIQMIRLDNPLLQRGLSLAQRYSFFTAAAHFTFPLPRFVFLTAPLAYLIFGDNIVRSSVLLVAAYALPHIIHSVVTNSRIQRQFRHSFWNEVYEAALTFHLMLPTLIPLVNPRAGKFNVTDKGGFVEREFFDARTLKLHIVLAFMLIFGIVCGIVRFVLGIDESVPGVTIMNMIWATLNLGTIGAVLSVGREQKQVRNHVRIGMRLPVTVHLPDGRTTTTVTSDISSGGARMPISDPSRFRTGDLVRVTLPRGADEVQFPARVTGVEKSAIRIAFALETMEQEIDLVEALFGRADAWIDWDKNPVDRPLHAFWSIIWVALGNLRVRRKRSIEAMVEPQGTPPAADQSVGTTKTAAMIALVLGGALALGSIARAADAPVLAPSSRPPTAPVDAPMPALPAPPAAASPSMPAGAALPAPTDAVPGAGDAAEDATRHELFRLSDFGVNGPIELKSVKSQIAVPFSIRRDEVVVGASLHLNYDYSRDLLPENSSLEVVLNGEPIGSLPLSRDTANGASMDLRVPPVLIVDHNTLGFRFNGHYAHTCEDPLNPTLWARVSDSSTLSLLTQTLALPNDLAILPRPFFDPNSFRGVGVTFVFAHAPSNAALEAAGVVASWMGSLAAYRGASFATALDALTPGDEIVFATPSEAPALLKVPNIDGPTVMITENPIDPSGKLLMILGRDSNELKTAATSLVMEHDSYRGSRVTVRPIDIPARQPYDAPRWITTNHPVRLGDLASPAELQPIGLLNSTARISFRSSPDLFNWGSHLIPLHIFYTHDHGNWLDERESHLDVVMNGTFVHALPFWPPDRWSLNSLLGRDEPADHLVEVPPFLLTGRNQLLLNFAYTPYSRGDCTTTLPTTVTSAIDPNSTIDLSRVPHFTQLPNLSFTVNSGFPYTLFADLGNTAIVMPAKPAAADIDLLMTLFGIFGDSTGFPALRATIVKPDQISAVAQKDLILIGHGSSFMTETSVAAALPIKLDDQTLRVVPDHEFQHYLTAFGLLSNAHDPASEGTAAVRIADAAGADIAAMIGIRSSLGRHRSVLAIVAPQPEKLRLVVEALKSRELLPRIQGDLALFTPRTVSGFRIGTSYTVGSLPMLTYYRWLLADHLVDLTIGLFVSITLLSLASYNALARRAKKRLSGNAGVPAQRRAA